MIGTSTKNPLIVEDVVTALTGEVAPGPNARAALRDRMQRATQEFDERTAEAFARALFESLSENPTDVRQLEALVILGLAHPQVLERFRISLDKEGERLGFLLERAGATERAESLRELLADRLTVEEVTTAAPVANVKSDPSGLIERYLRQADEAANAGRTREAIACLEEVRALDPRRRDVVRLIRDLRARRRVRKWQFLRAAKVLGLLGLVGLAGYGVYWRELHVRELYGALPVLAGDDAAAVRARIGAIENFIAEQHAWFAMPDALAEQRALEERLRRLTARSDAIAAEQRKQLADQVIEAEAARDRGLLFAKQGKFVEAVGDFELALKLAPRAWEHERRVRTDLDAIRAFLAQRDPAEERSR